MLGKNGTIVRAKLYLFIGRKGGLDLLHKLKLITLNIMLPVLTYVSIAWDHAAKSTRETVQLQRNISLRCAVNATGYVRIRVIYRDLEQTSITGMVRIKAIKELAKLGKHPNMHLRELLYYDLRFINRYKRPRSQMLDDYGSEVEAVSENEIKVKIQQVNSVVFSFRTRTEKRKENGNERRKKRHHSTIGFEKATAKHRSAKIINKKRRPKGQERR